MFPVYVAPSLVLFGNEVDLTPQMKFAVYFKQNIETSSMVSISKAYLPVTVDLNKYPKPVLTLSDQRVWNVTSD